MKVHQSVLGKHNLALMLLHIIKYICYRLFYCDSSYTMTDTNKHQFLNYFIATIWLANGLFCKVLNLVPRHQEIVARIIGDDHSRQFTLLIGLSEIIIAVWILSSFSTRLNALIQIVIIAVMNSFEFFLVPDLLLWGKANAVFAFMLILLIYYNEFHLNKKLALQT